MLTERLMEYQGTLVRTLARVDGPISWAILCELDQIVFRLRVGDRVVADNGAEVHRGQVVHSSRSWRLLCDDGTARPLSSFDGGSIRLLDDALDERGPVTEAQASPTLVHVGQGAYARDINMADVKAFAR